jgi:predicted HTH domain antitoxin
MANCVNINTAEFKGLSSEAKINPVVLAAKVSLWQEANGLDSFPSLGDLRIREFNTAKGFFQLDYVNPEGSVFTSNLLNSVAESHHPLFLIAQHLLKYKKLLNNSKSFLTPSKEMGFAMGSYSPSHHDIQISDSLDFKEAGVTILHEVLHAMSYKELRSNSTNAKHFQELYNHVKPQFKEFNMDTLEGNYATYTVDEFMVALHTDSRFILALQKMPALENLKFKNAYEEIMDYILSLLGIEKTKDPTLYAQAFFAAETILKDAQERLEDNQEYQKLVDDGYIPFSIKGGSIIGPISTSKASSLIGVPLTTKRRGNTINQKQASAIVRYNNAQETHHIKYSSKLINSNTGEYKFTYSIEKGKVTREGAKQKEIGNRNADAGYKNKQVISTIDEAIDNYFNNEERQVENSRTEQLDTLNEEFGKEENLSEEELNRIDVVNARHDMQLEVLERTRQARLEDRQENAEEESSFEEDTIDEALNNNPVLTAGSIFTPNYDTYLEDKKTLLKKVEKALVKLYTISGKNKNSSTIANINKLNNLKSSLEQTIDLFEKGVVTESILEDFFNRDINTISTLLDTNDFDNLYLAQDMLDFLDTNLNIVNSNSMFNSIDKDDNLMKVINNIVAKKIQLDVKLSNTYDSVFLNLLEKHYISFTRLSKYRGMSLEEIRKSLLDELKNASIFSNEALSIDKNLLTKSDVTRQLARLELELEQEKEKLLIAPAINKINNILVKGQQELSRLGLVTRVLGKNIYDYSLFIQKDPSGTKNYRLINKFSTAWFDYKEEINRVYNKKLSEAIDVKERNIALTEQYNEINSNADFIDFRLLHDIFIDNSLDRFKDGSGASATAYKNKLINTIGKENYDDLINEQRTKLQLFLEKRNEIIDNKIASIPGATDYNSLSDLERNKLKISIDTIDPLLFIENHLRYNTNKIPVQLGSQTIEFPAKLNYVSFVPRNAEYYNPDFDVIDEKQNPILYEMYQAFKEANDVIKDGLLGTGIELEKGQLINSRRNFRESLMDKSFAELTKNGLGHLLNIRQFLKDIASAKTEVDKESKEIRVSGQLVTVERVANRDYKNTIIELKNILNRNLYDTSVINWAILSPEQQKKVLDVLDRDNIDDILKKGEFKVKDLKQYSVANAISQQGMNLPLLLKANLDLVSEHKARVNSKNTISVLLNRIDKKNEESGNKKAKGAAKLEHWVKKNIYNESINNIQWGNYTERRTGEDNYNQYNGDLRSKYYKNFTKAEKKLFDSYTKRIKNIDAQLADPFIDALLSEKLTREQKGLKNSIVLMGKDYTAGAIVESILVKLPFLAGLAWNQVAPLKNFLNGMTMVLNRDGQFWTEGNASIAMNFFLGHPLKSLGSKFGLNDHQEEWKKAVLFIQSLRVIEDQTSELQRGEEENSKILSTGNFFTDGMYLTKKVEWINQSVSLMARAQDVKIEHPTKKNTDGSPYTIKMFDGQQFEAHEIVNGQLVLKAEWKTPDNVSNFEKMDSSEMLQWKVENKRVNASLNGDYSQEGSVMGKRSTLGRILFQFKTWVSQFLYDRFAYKQTDLALGIEHSGYYVGPIVNPRTRPAAIATFIAKSALAGLVTANFAGGAAIIIPAIGIAYLANEMRKKIRDRNIQSPLPLHSMTARGSWNQFKYVGYNLTTGLGITTANIATGVLIGKNYIPKIITDFEKTMQSEEDRQNFKNLQLLTKSLQANMVTTMLSMLFLALRGTDKDDDEKNKEQDKWYINAALNLTTNLYSESNFADNPLLMYESLIQRQGANSLVDNSMKLALYVTHLENDTLKSGDHEGESKTLRQAKKMMVPMMIRNIDKIGTEDYLLGYESLVGKYYKQDSPLEEYFDSDLKKETKSRRDKRADVKAEIRERLEEDYTITDSKADKAILNQKAIEGYQDIKGVPVIDRSRYDKDENLIE